LNRSATPAPFRGPGEALLLCAGERQLISLLASQKAKRLFSTTPSELAARNRRQRTVFRRQDATQVTAPASETVATVSARASRPAVSADLFDGFEPDALTPVHSRSFSGGSNDS
jgi:hypothetical protein